MFRDEVLSKKRSRLYGQVVFSTSISVWLTTGLLLFSAFSLLTYGYFGTYRETSIVEGRLVHRSSMGNYDYLHQVDESTLSLTSYYVEFFIDDAAAPLVIPGAGIKVILSDLDGQYRTFESQILASFRNSAESQGGTLPNSPSSTGIGLVSLVSNDEIDQWLEAEGLDLSNWRVTLKVETNERKLIYAFSSALG